MTPNAASGPSRRSFLASTAVATAAVAGGLPLLSACGGSDGGSRDGTTSGKDAKKILPAYVASNVVTPDIPSKNGSAVGFTGKLDLAGLKTSVPEKLGKGGEVTVMSPFWGSPPKEDNAYYRAMNDLIGVDVVWQNQDGNTYDQKLGAVLASSEVPDVVVVPGWNMTGKIPSAIIGKFADLGPYLSGDAVKEYPNLAAIPTDAWQRSLFGGKLRGLPMPSSYVPAIVPFYRQDIFEKEGYEVPRSCDEFMALAKEATNARAKRWACLDMKWTAFNAFGVLSGNEKSLGWNEVDGKLVYRIETDEYLEALEWTRKLFAAGVVHPDAKLGKSNAADPGPKFAAGEFLIYNQDMSQWWSRTAEQAVQNPEFKIWGMDLFGHDGGAPTLWAQNPASIFAFVNKKASEAVIRDVLAVANVTAAPYGTKEYMATNYGVEGTHYTVKDGVPTKTDQGNIDVMNAYVMVASPAATIAHPDFPAVAKGQVEWQQRMGAVTKKPAFYGMQITEPARWTNLSNDFEQLEDDVVRGRKKIGDVQQAVSDWKSKGGDKLRDWYRKILDENGPAAG
ncbi:MULTISPECIES: extracellular solute-binding protein [Streptomyces]|uniref:Extracellular solute-binding protein n=1 Tax=Streptomyces ardesiacus TaxID=285564 RepID=A0ABW8HEY1_9ACTN|nr:MULTISPECIES: extracellular solute-binding protein [Streptomyces]NEB61353.1 extracellular solute-binding protein [Streptomyces diastaticus]KOT94954.1 Tat pathway signal sequence domain protein [Streptomyces sp. NRRL F-4711]KOX38114.1 Tat pathway signal sequence domain protein [Streptomyces sp. NRRL F-4707]KOX51043.1 Tat pathway signal sequence domain protein [Streptomyces sp. NRRL F-7442]MCL7367488.1 extracellular solute-binding protein [Streptomyces ardesiacus]